MIKIKQYLSRRPITKLKIQQIINISPWKSLNLYFRLDTKDIILIYF